MEKLELNWKLPSIEVLSNLDNRKDVWCISRPHLDPKDTEINDILNVDLPVHQFGQVYFKITSSLLLRDILYTVRPSANWAVSNRTTEITKDTLCYSSEYKYDKYWGPSEVASHNKSVDTSVPQDFRKENFLYYVSTTYCFGTDLRTLSNIICSLLNSPLGFYGEMFLSALKIYDPREICPCNEDFFINNYGINKERLVGLELCSESPIVGHNSITEQVYILTKASGSLLSQFIRQAYADVKHELINLVFDGVELLVDCPSHQSDDYIALSMTDEFKARKLVLTRACWFAKFDKANSSSWANIVSSIIQELKMTAPEVLICGGEMKNCKWKAEQLARCKAGNPNGSKGEVNPPCPILVGIPEMIELRELKYSPDSKLFEVWKGFRDTILSESELTEHGEEYLENVKAYGYAEKSDNEKFDKFTTKLLNKYLEK